MGKIFDKLAGIYEGDRTTADPKTWRDISSSTKKAEDVYKRRLCGASLFLLGCVGVVCGFAAEDIIPVWTLGISIPLGVVALHMWSAGYRYDAEKYYYPVGYSTEYTKIMTDDYNDTSLEACQVARNTLEDLETVDGIGVCTFFNKDGTCQKNRSLGPLVRNGVITLEQAKEILRLYDKRYEIRESFSERTRSLDASLQENAAQTEAFKNKKAEILRKYKNEESLLARIDSRDKDNYLSHEESLKKLQAEKEHFESAKQQIDQEQHAAMDQLNAEWRAFKRANNWGSAQRLSVLRSTAPAEPRLI